jgi:trk system potassium uptake protein TrkH
VARLTRARLRRAFRRESIGVDLAASFDLIGLLLLYLSPTYLFPTAIALLYGEPPWPFLVGGAVTAAAGGLLQLVATGRELASPREGFFVVAITWLLVPVFGAIPFLVAGEGVLGEPVNAYFESVSGFTATGATVLTDFSDLSRSLGMWRQFTQWLGGMGIVVLAVAILPQLRVGGRQLLQSELPGPTDLEHLAVSIREVARRLWVLYVALTTILIALLALYGWTGLDEQMDLYDAAAHAFSTVALGGFSTQGNSIAAFGALVQWTIALFLVIAGVNFLRLYRVFVQRQPRAVTRDDEFRLYLLVLLLASAVVFAELLAREDYSFADGLRNAVFQTVSIMSTAGFATADYVLWGPLATVTLLGLMFIGASAGSTGGSIKVVRHALIGRLLRRELEQTVHPEVVAPIRLNRQVVDERTLRAVLAFVLIYVGLFAVGSLAIVLDSFRINGEISPFEAMGAAAATLGNVGPGFGFAGPFGSYESFSSLSKGVMIALMWMGRVEIIPVIVLFTRQYWRA